MTTRDAIAIPGERKGTDMVDGVEFLSKREVIWRYRHESGITKKDMIEIKKITGTMECNL